MSKKEIIPTCPYCADPSMFAPPKGKATDTTPSVVRLPAHFWRDRRKGFYSAQAGMYGQRWVAVIPSEAFAKQYADFAVRLIGVDVGFALPPPPLPFGNYVLGPRVKPPGVQPPYALVKNVGLAMFSAFVMEPYEGKIKGEAHWWPTHEFKIAVSNFNPDYDFETLTRALRFFKPETRGGEKKITEVRLKDALSELGKDATQRGIAAHLQVSETALEKWRRRQNIDTWREVVNRYAPA